MTAIVIASIRKAVKKMAEQRLIDANALREDWLENGENEYVYDTNSFLESLDDAPTIDPEALPIVRQLRAELALITHQRDVYKSVFERITAHGDCNDCGKVKECQFAPKWGEDTRYNCPLWNGSQPHDHEALTLEQLRNMRGKWVWIASHDKNLTVSGWAYVGEEHVFTYWEYEQDKLVGRVIYDIRDYGSWLAYAHKPEACKQVKADT